MIDQDVYIPLRLSWTLVCKIACLAMIKKVSFDDVCEMAIQKKLEQFK